MFTLPKLPYAYDAMEPYIDARTMEIHYTKHHQAYVNNLNTALAGHPELKERTIEECLTHINGLPDIFYFSHVRGQSRINQRL